MNKRIRKKKLALKRETLRKLDPNELKAAAGGAVAYSGRCTTMCAGGDAQAGGSGGCTTQYQFNYNYDYDQG